MALQLSFVVDKICDEFDATLLPCCRTVESGGFASHGFSGIKSWQCCHAHGRVPSIYKYWPYPPIVYAVKRDRITCLGVFGTFSPLKTAGSTLRMLCRAAGARVKGLMLAIVVYIEIASLVCCLDDLLPDSML